MRGHMGIRILIIILSLNITGSLLHADEYGFPQPSLTKDPFSQPIPADSTKKDYSVYVRFINNGLNMQELSIISKLTFATEKIYSQCPGVRFHVNVIGTQTGPATTFQDSLIDYMPSGSVLSEGFFQFFLPWFSTKQTDSVIDLHFVDYIDIYF